MRAAPAAGKLRIIGGSLRNSKLEVPNAPGLRPTPDRVRETLFNWLMPVIEGATCLDLFAGTGALGIEAWSRGARPVEFVERDASLATRLRCELARLRVVEATVHAGDALGHLQHSPAHACDIVFLDPPFSGDFWTSAAQALESFGWLKPQAWIYVENPADRPPTLPTSWQLHRESRAGDVAFALYRRDVR